MPGGRRNRLYVSSLILCLGVIARGCCDSSLCWVRSRFILSYECGTQISDQNTSLMAQNLDNNQEQNLWLIQDPKELCKTLDELELNPLITNYSENVLGLHVQSKLGVADFFGLSMLLRRNHKCTLPLLELARRMVVMEKECKFKELVESLVATEYLADRKDGIVGAVRVHIVGRMARLFTCYKIEELSSILGINSAQGPIYFEDLGYKTEGGWVVLEVPHSRDSKTATDKQALRKKLLELTQLTNLLEKSK